MTLLIVGLLSACKGNNMQDVGRNTNHPDRVTEPTRVSDNRHFRGGDDRGFPVRDNRTNRFRDDGRNNNDLGFPVNDNRINNNRTNDNRIGGNRVSNRNFDGNRVNDNHFRDQGLGNNRHEGNRLRNRNTTNDSVNSRNVTDNVTDGFMDGRQGALERNNRGTTSDFTRRGRIGDNRGITGQRTGTTGTDGVTGTTGNNRTTGTTGSRTNEPNMRVADKVADRITTMKEVDSANVLVTDKNAYVAAKLAPNQNLTKELERKISKRVKSTDRDIDNVYVSVNADFFDRTTTYTEDIRQGRPVAGFFEEFTESVRRLFPNNFSK